MRPLGVELALYAPGVGPLYRWEGPGKRKGPCAPLLAVGDLAASLLAAPWLYLHHKAWKV